MIFTSADNIAEHFFISGNHPLMLPPLFTSTYGKPVSDEVIPHVNHIRLREENHLSPVCVAMRKMYPRECPRVHMDARLVVECDHRQGFLRSRF